MSGKYKHRVVVEFTTDQPCDGVAYLDRALLPVRFASQPVLKRLDRVLGAHKARWNREAAAAYQFPKESRQELLAAAREALDRYKAKNPPIRADGAGFADLDPSPNQLATQLLRGQGVSGEDGARGAVPTELPVTEHLIIADSTPADGKVHIFQVHNGFTCTKCGKSLAPDDHTVSNALQHMMHKDRCM